MRVLLTGGVGFIGSHIADLLIDEGNKVIIIDNLSNGVRDYIPNQCKIYKTDILSSELDTIFHTEEPEVIIHQAAQVSVIKSNEHPFQDAENNILTTIKLLELAKKYKVKKFIFASTSAVYGMSKEPQPSEESVLAPISFYGLSKQVCESYISLYSNIHHIPFTIFRYSNVYGPRQVHNSEGGVIAIFIQHAINKQAPTIYGDGTQTRDFIYVKDIARANVLAMKNGHNEIFNLSTGVETSVNELWKEISKLSSVNLTPNYKDARTGEVLNSSLNSDKAKKILNWQPSFSLYQGLRETYQEQKKIHDKNN